MADQAKDRPAMPSGDCTSWGVLVAGTILEGRAWPGFGLLGWDCPLTTTDVTL